MIFNRHLSNAKGLIMKRDNHGYPFFYGFAGKQEFKFVNILKIYLYLTKYKFRQV